MEKCIETMKQRLKSIKTAIKSAEKDKARFPKGRLRVSQSKNQVRYYQVESSDNFSGLYLTKEQHDVAKALAQKDYNEEFLKSARLELEELNRTIRQLSETNADLAYQNLDPRRRRLVEPYIIPDDEYAANWLNQTFKTNSFMPEAKIYDTKNGEKVRSKSEAILADLFLEFGIPYHYEQALFLKDKSVRYPDFTLLKVATREEIYLEHFGLLDDEEYRNKCLEKLDEYRQNGIFPGKNLLITYESEAFPLDIKGIRKMIKELFL
ncbi:MAG: hypothetical protein J5509_10315 [Lachnospiraceae bacterium]|nr:hypothetical protein [Lachnospiraceae bacterium]